jgi:putative heme iron utilization protein
MASDTAREVARLIAGQRWGTLATLDDGAPLASMVAYAIEPGMSGLLFFLSGLSAHTRNLLADPRASLAVGEPDRGEGDPQTLPRVSLQGQALPIERDDPAFESAWSSYVARFPDAAPRLELADFVLFRFRFEDARYVGGFARAARLEGREIAEAAG